LKATKKMILKLLLERFYDEMLNPSSGHSLANSCVDFRAASVVELSYLTLLRSATLMSGSWDGHCPAVAG